jgi:DNA-binding transcriptional MocR family regulator
MSSTPLLYRQVAADLSAQIRAGRLSAGMRLPSVRQLARQKQVSVATAVRAMAWLDQAGLIESRPQSGHYVRVPRGRLAPPSTPPVRLREQLAGRAELIASMLKAARTHDGLSFSAGALDPDLFPHRALRQILASVSRRRPRLLTTYSLAPGARPLHATISAMYARWGCSLDPDELVTVSGCMEGVTLCLRAVTQPGDLVVVETPTFFGILQALEYLGLRAIEIPSSHSRGMDLDVLRTVLATRPVKAVIASPNLNNPLGASMSEEDKRRLVALVHAAGVPLIEDDAYGDFADAAPRAIPAKAYDVSGQVMLCSSFTKSLAPGFRIGWVAAGRYHARVESQKLVSSIGSPVLLESVLATYLGSRAFERFLRGLRRRLAALREEYSDLIAETFPQGTRLSAPKGGYLLWVELPEGLDTAAILARHPALAYAPGAAFSPSGRDFGNCLRLSTGQPLTPAVAAHLARLGRTLDLALASA